MSTLDHACFFAFWVVQRAKEGGLLLLCIRITNFKVIKTC